MSKRIAFCADGTWDTSAKNTNVYKLFKSLAVSADQMPFMTTASVQMETQFGN